MALDRRSRRCAMTMGEAGDPVGESAGDAAGGTAELLVETAERMFAERGIDAVSLREIGKAAGSRNTSVAHYHFGGKPGLIAAVIARRAPLLNGRRMQLLREATDASAGDGVAAEALVRVLVTPLVEELDRGGHYVTFLARLAAESPTAVWVDGDDASASSYRHVLHALERALPGLDRRRFRHRSELLLRLILDAVAARQHAEAAGIASVATRGAFVEDLMEAAAGLLLAPVGAQRRDPRVGGVVR
jgi:AcrR family transcriptional regulator